MKAIMIVDDEFIILESLRMQIERIIGPDVLLETASSAEEACKEIAAIAGKGLDLRLVISDFNLDDGKGTEVLTFALNLYPGMRKVILSGQSDNKMISEFDEKYGLDAFIGKPWNFDEIDRLVHRAID